MYADTHLQFCVLVKLVTVHCIFHASSSLVEMMYAACSVPIETFVSYCSQKYKQMAKHAPEKCAIDQGTAQY